MKFFVLALNIALLFFNPSNGLEKSTISSITSGVVVEETTTPSSSLNSSPKTTTFIPRQSGDTVTVKPKLNEPQVMNFSIPKNKPMETCLKVNMLALFEIDYLKINDTSKSTLRFDLDELNDYEGECNSNLNTLKIRFHNDWMLKINFTLVEKTYQLEGISLEYTVDSKQFPNASQNEMGHRTVKANNLGLFSTVLGNSFKCESETKVKLFDTNEQRAVMIIRKYQGQPFMSGDKEREFGTAVECIGDRLSANKLVPIIVGSVLAALVLVILISYIVGRRKHRGNPSYQQV